MARWLVYAGVPIGLAASVAVGAFGFANGGYFPVSWGWGGVALLALVALALAVGVTVELGTLDLVFVGALAGLAGWIALSLLWTAGVPTTVLEIERVLVYVAAAAAGVLLLRRRSVPTVVLGLWLALAVVATYALLTRLFPDRLGAFDEISVYRLSGPVGYWNALGILSAIGWLLAAGMAARSGPLVRCLAAGSTVIFALTLYFTFSRASWIALFVGLAVAIALDPRRLQLITVELVLAPWSIAAVAFASTSAALTHQDAVLASAVRDGHGLAVIAIGLIVGASLTILVFDWLAASISVSHGVKRVYAGTLLFVLAALLIVVFGRYGFPPTLARKAYNAFNTVRVDGSDLNSHLFNLSGNGRSEHWHTAWQEASDHPFLGGGAGSYAQYWAQHRRILTSVHDAHSLYLETLAELGPIGLALLLAALAAPLLALRRARSSPLVPIACGAYVAFLLHAAADWDWEMPAVTLTGLFCGLVLLAAGRREREPRPLGPGIRVAGLAGAAGLFAFALLALLGNSAVSASSKSTDAGRYARAEQQARDAMSYLPWSSEPWRKLGEAQAVSGNLVAARVSFRRALAKDPSDWTLWYELALASRGEARRQAFAEASRLNPLDGRLRPQA
ncbi:MAG TPA: O-antigen ligase family protein [Gaiellaceae bacterium]